MERMALLPESSMDRRLIKSAAKYETPEQMSEAVMRQLTPAQCVERLQYLLSSKTPLDEVQERRLLLINMAETLDWFKTMKHNDKAWPQISRMLKIMSDQIERTTISIEDVNTKLSSQHAEFFVNALTIGLDRAVKALAESTQGEIIEAEIVEDATREAVESAQEYMKQVTARELDS